MKKVLAAVMAVAMAASMSAVAFATDYQNNGTWFDPSQGSSNSAKGDDQLVIGKEKKYDVRIESVELRDGVGYEFTTQELASMMDDNLLSASVVVTSGKDKLDSIPTVKEVGNTAQVKVKFRDTYDTKDVSAKIRVRFTAKRDVYSTYIYSFEKLDPVDNKWKTQYAIQDDAEKGVEKESDAVALTFAEYQNLVDYV